MKRITTLIIYCGWFLMIPPRVGTTPNIRDQDPISKWVHIESFDNAKDCGDYRFSVVKENEGENTDNARYLNWAYAYGRGIPAELVPIK